MPNRQRGGRIHPHQRDTNDAAPILGDTSDFALTANFEQQHNETLAVSMTNKNRKDCRARLVRIANHWEENCNNYYEIGVRQVSQEDQNNPSKFFFSGLYKLDLVCTGLNYKFVLEFLMNTKCKSNGKLKSNQDIRKYKDAILWGAKVAGERLPTRFYEEIDKHLASWKKLVIEAKKKGSVNEKAADPITVTLCQSILKWAIESNNIFVWFWTLTQWNCMARCASVDPLAFHNFKLGQDSTICKCDDQKADKDGERLSEKNICANPVDWSVCFWTGMGICIATNCDALASHERLFLRENIKEGSASKRHCEQLQSIVDQHQVEVMAQVRPERFNPCGLRKGSATHAVSGTTLPPSLPSIARRGEWSQGSVLDVHWHFASVGDHCLGRILAGLQPNESSFSSPPPHFNVSSPLENAEIRSAMEMMFGPILARHNREPNNPTPMLMRCLACIVHHSDNLANAMSNNPGHDFSKLAILHHKPLLDKLKELVTLKPTTGAVTVATGMPPHIELASQVQKVLDLTSDLLSNFSNQTQEVISAVQKAVEDQALESGHVTGSRLLEVLNEFQERSFTSIDKRLEEMQNEFGFTTFAPKLATHSRRKTNCTCIVPKNASNR